MGGYIRRLLNWSKVIILPLIIAVLIIGNFGLAGELRNANESVKEQESMLIKTNAEWKATQKSKSVIEAQLDNEKSKTEELRQENESLKAELQAKIERESRQEANLYVAGNCTWYVKERVPYIGGTWGNANQWLASAQAYGFSYGGQPRDGDIGVSLAGYYGHVVYVESVNKDGSVTISEMNAPILGAVTSRTVSADSFIYIHT